MAILLKLEREHLAIAKGNSEALQKIAVQTASLRAELKSRGTQVPPIQAQHEVPIQKGGDPTPKEGEAPAGPMRKKKMGKKAGPYKLRKAKEGGKGIKGEGPKDGEKEQPKEGDEGKVPPIGLIEHPVLSESAATSSGSGEAPEVVAETP